MYLIKLFVHILNIFLMNGVVPNQLKIAKVTPIFKKGEATEICIFRPHIFT